MLGRYVIDGKLTQITNYDRTIAAIVLKAFKTVAPTGSIGLAVDAGIVLLANERIQNVETYFPTVIAREVVYAGPFNIANQNWDYDYNLYEIPGIWDIQFDASLGQAVINTDDFWYKGQVKSATVGEGFGFLKIKNGGVWRGFQNSTM